MSPVFEQGLLERAGDYVKISVKDMGTGIDKGFSLKVRRGVPSYQRVLVIDMFFGQLKDVFWNDNTHIQGGFQINS